MRCFTDKTFTGVVKEGVRLEDLRFENCTFDGCKFIDCTFINCEFTECTFTGGAFVRPETKGTSMSFVSFLSCSVVGVRWADFCGGGVSFPLQKVENCCLKYNDFDRMNFRKFDFSNNEIPDSAFRMCNLTEARFSGSRLSKTEFSGCDLRKCDFRGATGYLVPVTENRVKGAKFSYPEALRLLAPFEIEIGD